MEFGIIAAGEGSRLAAEGVTLPKPLVALQQQPLIERLVRQFAANGAEMIHIVINEYSPAVEMLLQQLSVFLPINIIKKTTPSSLHSFYEIVQQATSERICVTTVDTVFDGSEFALYLKAFEMDDTCDALMAVTSFIDDESPLYIAVDEAGNILRYADAKEVNCNYVSGGIYCVKRSTYQAVNATVQSGVFRMRNFQKRLVENGFAVKAFEFTKIIDIDHVADIAVAEQWLNEKAGKDHV